MVIVQLVKVGKEVKTYDVSDNPTVGNLLDKAGEQFVPNTITVNYENTISRDTELDDGDRVFIGTARKANSPFVVEFIRLGQGEVIQVSADDNMTLKQCIDMMNPGNRENFINQNNEEVFTYQISGSQKTINDIVPSPISEGGSVRVICGVKRKAN